MDRDKKRQLISRCKPDEPVGPEDARHYDFDTPDLLLRGRPWRERLVEVIDLSDAPTTQLVTGLRGSGKTTELHQAKLALEQRGYAVVVADIGQWISDARPIVGEDLLLAAVLALYPEGDPTTLGGWAKESLERFKSFFKSRVDLEAGAAGVKAKLSTDNTLFQRVATKLRDADGVREEVHQLIEETAVAYLRDTHKELVLILDGAEKRATGDLLGPEQRAGFHNHWFGAFLTGSRDIRIPMHAIYTVPPFMVRRSAEIAAQFGVELSFLPMVRVFGHVGEPNPAGVRALVEALALRVAPELYEDPAIPRWLALRSGGYFRDLLRFVTEMTYVVGDAPTFTREHAERAIAVVRQSYREGFVAEERDLLSELRPSRQFPEREDSLARMDALLLGFKMFRYHNDRAWYDAHPLLWADLGFPEAGWADVETLA